MPMPEKKENHLFLENMPVSCSWATLQTMFSEFGKIVKIYIPPTREFGKVMFEQTESAIQATQFVNEHHPLGMSAMSFTSPPKTKPTGSDSDSSFDVYSSKFTKPSKKRPSNDVETKVNRIYVDVFGRIITTLEDDNGDIYVSLNELKKSGFELFQVGSLPARSSSHVYDAQKIFQFETYMKVKAAEFMSSVKFNVPEEKVRNIIENEKLDYFDMNKDVKPNAIPPLMSLKTFPVKSFNLNNENQCTGVNNSTEAVKASKNVNQGFEKNKTTKDSENLVNKVNQENSQCDINSNDNTKQRKLLGLRKPFSFEETATTNVLSRVALELHKKQEVKVVHVESEETFWVQLTANMATIKHITLSIISESDTACSVQPVVNMICSVLHNHTWFRAVVLNTVPLKVQYIDYGNESTGTLTKIFKLSDRLASFPAQAIRLHVNGNRVNLEKGSVVEVTPLKQENSFTYLAHLDQPQVFHSTPVSSPHNQKPMKDDCSMIVTNSTSELNRTLLRKLSIEKVSNSGIFEFAQSTSDTTFTAFALPDTLTDEVCKLEDIAKDCKPDPNFKPHVGDLVAAQTSHGFVRATVISHSNGKYKCGLIDFGIIETTDEICLLPGKYLTLPEFSFECKLKKDFIEEIKKCKSGEIEIKSAKLITFKLKDDKKFEAQGYRWDPLTSPLSDTDQLKANLIKHTSNDNLTSQESTRRKVVTETVSDSGIFDFVESTSDRSFVAFACPNSASEEICSLESISEDSQSNKSFKPKVGDVIAANTPDGFVRGLVLQASNDKYKCALIDFGTIKMVEEVRNLPDKYKSIPEFAIECETTPDVIKDLKVHKCTAFSVPSANVVHVTLDNGNQHKFNVRVWNPLPINSSSSSETVKQHTPNVKPTTVQRKLVIEHTCDSGVFDFIKQIDEHRFIAFALPDSFADDLCALEGLSEDCKFDASFKPETDDFVAFETSDGFVRGIILSIKNDQYTCALIDFGTITTTDKVYKLPAKYSGIPEFAFVCKVENGSASDFKSSKCVSLQIKSPKLLNISLESGKQYVIHGSVWNPKEISHSDIRTDTKQNNSPNVSKTSYKKERNLVIDDICETGVFEFVDSIDGNTFIGFAFPCTRTKEVETLNEITNKCERDPLSTLKPGDLVAVSYNDSLVRAYIISVSDQKYKCALIDYGLITVVDELYHLPDTYQPIPEFCFESKTEPHILEALKDTPCKYLEIKSPRVLTLHLETGQTYEVKGYPWNVMSSNTVKKKIVTNIEKPKQSVFKGEPSGIVLKDKEQVRIVGVLDNFLLVRNKESTILFKSIEQELVDYKGEPFLEKPEINYLAVCNFNDSAWYRVLIKDLKESSAQIEYVDYGDVASVPIKDLKVINEKLASMKNSLIKIRLKNFAGTNFNQKNLETLMQVNEKKEKFVVDRVVGENNVYDLIGSDNESLSVRLQELPKPLRSSTPASIKREKIVNAIISKRKSVCKLNDVLNKNIQVGPVELICLFTDYLHEGNVTFCKADDETRSLINEVALAVAKYKEDDASYDPELHEVCLAKFEGEWCRAAVIKITEAKTYGVFYIDYGNSHVVTAKDIRKLPEDLAKIQALAVFCTLDGVLKENDEEVKNPLLQRLKNDIVETEIYNVNVISCESNSYKITIPSLYEQWKKDGLF